LLALLFLVAAVALGGAGCAPRGSAADDRPGGAVGTAEKTASEAKEPEGVPVAALPLRRGPIESVLRFSTHLEADRSVEVLAEAARQVEELLVEEGSRVQVGDTLARLRAEEQRSALEKVTSQLEKARRELERQQSLFEKELISEQSFNDARYDFEQLEIARVDAERELSYATVRAPISGVITDRLVNVGDYVQRNEHLFDLVDFDHLLARVYVPERELSRLRVGQESRLFAQALGGERRAARIERIAPTVDPKSGTVKVTVEVSERSGLRPGMYVEVELVAAVEQAALLVPKRALVYDQDQVFVFRVDAEKNAERLLIEPVLEDADFVSVAGGLEESDLIVVAGQTGLKPGSQVRLLDLQEAMAAFGASVPAEEIERLGNRLGESR
jgi:membrane fusion protein (multidrug efflux system)